MNCTAKLGHLLNKYRWLKTLTDRLIGGTFGEQFAALFILTLPIELLWGYSSLAKHGVFGGIALAVSEALLDSLVVTITWYCFAGLTTRLKSKNPPCDGSGEGGP